MRRPWVEEVAGGEIFLVVAVAYRFSHPPLRRMQAVSEAVERVLVAAQRQDRLTVGVYESAKLMNV